MICSLCCGLAIWRRLSWDTLLLLYLVSVLFLSIMHLLSSGRLAIDQLVLSGLKVQMLTGAVCLGISGAGSQGLPPMAAGPRGWKRKPSGLLRSNLILLHSIVWKYQRRSTNPRFGGPTPWSTSICEYGNGISSLNMLTAPKRKRNPLPFNS